MVIAYAVSIGKWKRQHCRQWSDYPIPFLGLFSRAASAPQVLTHCISVAHNSQKLEEPLTDMCVGWCRNHRSLLDLLSRVIYIKLTFLIYGSVES